MRYLAISAALLASTAAQANDIDATAYNWSGAYVGIRAGGVKHGDALSGGETQEFVKGKALPFIGAYSGYNFVLGKVVIGPEIEFGRSNQSYRSYGYYYMGEDVPIAVVEHNTKIPRTNLTIKARLGITHERMLFYAGTGPTYKWESNSVGGNNDKKNGWAYSLGMERAITDNLIGRLEYTQHNLGTVSRGGDDYVDYNFRAVTVGMAYKF